MKQGLSSKGIEIVSFFSGAGFLDLGFEEAGYQIAFANEFYKPFINAYTHSRQRMGLPLPIHGIAEGSIEAFLKGQDSTQLKEIVSAVKERNNLVGFIGGPPCPDFSVGGKNRGKEGENGRLSGTYVDLILKQKPDFFLFENVRGLWRTKRHREFYDSLKSRLEKAGYKLHDKLINAISYGAPQDRDRIILIGVKKDLIVEDIEFPWNRYARYPDKQAFQYAWPEQDEYEEGSKRVRPKSIPEELTVEYWFKKNAVSKHPNASHAFVPKAGLIKFQTIAEGDAQKKSYKRLHRWRYSPTACYGNNEVHIHPYLPRRLSAAEALAIQSLPKKFELPSTMTLTDMFKTIGNGVPFVAALALANSIKDYLQEATHHEINSCESSQCYSKVAAE